MSDNNDVSTVTDEQRQAVREKYGAVGVNKGKNESLSALGWIAIIGFAIAAVSLIVILSAESLLTVTVASGLVGTGVTVGFLALIGHLVAKAIITSRE